MGSLAPPAGSRFSAGSGRWLQRNAEQFSVSAFFTVWFNGRAPKWPPVSIAKDTHRDNKPPNDPKSGDCRLETGVRSIHSQLEIPMSVRYVKNGRGGCWWQTAKKTGQIHGGWKEIPANLIENPGDLFEIRHKYGGIPGVPKDPGAFKRDLNQLLTLLDRPSQHVWITFEDGRLWWCTVGDKATANQQGENRQSGHFWLTCKLPWSDRSLTGRPLARADLPGIVDRVAGFRDTVCKPREEVAILRLIRGEVNPLVAHAEDAGRTYAQAISKMISELNWQDFEQLIDLILARTAWTRISKTGGYQEGFDIEAQNLTADEIAFVQVKSEASQSTLDDYVRRFTERRDRYDRMVFAVHNGKGELAPPSGLPVQVWTGDLVARLVVRLGLGEWVGSKLA